MRDVLSVLAALAALVGVAYIGHRFRHSERFQRLLDGLVFLISCGVLAAITIAILSDWAGFVEAVQDAPTIAGDMIRNGLANFAAWWHAD